MLAPLWVKLLAARAHYKRSLNFFTHNMTVFAKTMFPNHAAADCTFRQVAGSAGDHTKLILRQQHFIGGKESVQVFLGICISEPFLLLLTQPIFQIITDRIGIVAAGLNGKCLSVCVIPLS